MNDKAKAENYAVLANSAAWQDLLKWMDQERRESIARMDSIATAELTAAVVAEERGIRKGFAKILRRIEDVQEDR